MHQFNNSNTKKPPSTALPSTPTKKPLPTPIQTHVNNQLFNRLTTTTNQSSTTTAATSSSPSVGSSVSSSSSSSSNSSGNSSLSGGINQSPPQQPITTNPPPNKPPSSFNPHQNNNSIYSISRFNYTSSIMTNSSTTSGISKSGVILDDDDETIFSKFGKGASTTPFKNSFNNTSTTPNSVNTGVTSSSSNSTNIVSNTSTGVAGGTSSSNNSSPSNKSKTGTTTANASNTPGRSNSIQLLDNHDKPLSPSSFRKDTLSDDGIINSGGSFSAERKKKLRKSGSSSSSLSFNNPLGLTAQTTTGGGVGGGGGGTSSINSFSLLDEHHHDRYDEFYDEEEYPSLESPTFALAPSVVKRHKMKLKSWDNTSNAAGGDFKKESIITEDLLSSIEQSMEDLLDSDNIGFVFPTSSHTTTNTGHMAHHNSGELGLFGDSSSLHSSVYQQSSLPMKMFSSTSSSGSFKGSFHNLDVNIPFIYTTSEEEIEISTTGSISTNTTSTSMDDYSGYFGSNTPTTVAGNQFNHPFSTTNNNNNINNNNNNNNTIGHHSPNTPPSSPSDKDARSRDRMITASPKQLPKVKSKPIIEDDVVTSDSNSSSDDDLYGSEKNSSENLIDYTDCENIDEMNDIFEKEVTNSEKEKKISSDIQRLISNAPSFQSLLVLIKKMKEHSLIYHDNSQKIRSTIFQSLKKKIKELNNRYQLQSINSDLVNTRRDLDIIFQMCNLLPNEEIIYCMIQSPIVAEINTENDLNEVANLLENIQMNINQANSIQGYFRLFDGTKRWLIHIFTHNIRIVESNDSKEVTNSQSKRTSTSLLFLLQSQQNTMNLENFLLFVDRLVKLNFLKEYVHVLLDELMLTPFFVSLSAFEFIEFMGRFKGSMFSTTLKTYIIEKCCQFITQSAISKDVNLLFDIITSVTDRDISLIFLKTLLLSSNLQQNYETIVKNPLCYNFFKFIKNSEKVIGNENFTKIQTDVSALMDVYFKLVFQLLDKTCTISTLHMVLKHETQFMKLVYLMGDVGFNESHIKQLRQETLSFKTTLDAAQNFLTMFADDPNFFDTSLVLDTIIKIRRNMGEMVFKKIQKQVSELIPFGFEELAFFYELRTSEFFLVLWRDLYTKASNNEKHTIDSIKNKLVPDVKNKWLGFYKSIDSLSIKLNEFYSILRKCRYENRVDNLLSSTNVQYQEELLRVRMTFNGKSSDRNPNKEDLDWVSKRLNIINSFEKINLYRSYLPSLLLLIEHFEPYFTIDLKRDTDHLQLKKEANTLNQQSMLESQTLAMFEDQKNNFNLLLFTRFFKGFNDNQLSFIKLLCDSTGFSIIDWLLNYKSNSEFDNLVEICKSYTDSVKILQSLKSLVVVRDCISAFIYTNQTEHSNIVFISLDNFKNSITKLEISNDDLSQLSNLKKNFTLLLGMFEEKTRSGGVQALYDLAAITERGQYEFNLSDPSVILCKVMPSNPITNSSQIRRLSFQQQVITIDGLVELRNKLMLSEIPDNIKTLDDVNSKINLFVKCITLMLDIKASLLDLCKQAHFEFQENYFNAIRASECTPEYIQKYHAELLEQLEKWKKITEHSRNGNYYMSLFRAKESLRVYELLKKYQQESERSCIYDLLSILKLGDHNLELSDIENCITVLNLDFVRDCTAEEKMAKLCSFIESIFSRRDNTYRKSQYELPTSVTSKYSLNNFDGVFKIIKLQKEKEVMDAIISLYSLYGRLPLSEEVLLCNSYSTDMEDIELILNRWLNSSVKEKRDNIYCIGNIQELPYVIQSKMLLKIQEILSSLSKKNNQKIGKLVLIGGSDNNNARLLLEFSNYVDKAFKTLPKKYIVNIMKSYQGSNVKCVTSNRTGAGKSRFILKDIYLNKKKYSRVTVLEDSTVKEIVGLLWRTTNQNQGKEIAFHLALCNIIPKHMNSLLFELFYLGCIRDRETASVFHIVPNIQFYIEIPNSLCVPILGEFVYFCTALPTEEISTDESSLEIVNYELINMEDDSIDIMCTDDNKVQYVCKFLRAFEENVFKNAAPNVPDFDPVKVQDLSLKACFKLLCKYTGFKPDNVSFSVVNNFVRFLYGQFMSTSRYVCFKNCVMEGSMQLFKHAMIDLMIKSARDLTAISVEKDFIISLAKKYEGKPYTEILLLQYIEMFEHRLSKWEEQASQHPLVVFYRSNTNEITGIDLIGINTDKLELNEDLKYSLSCNGIDLETPRDLSHDRAQEIIRNVAGLKQDESNEKKISNNYVLTVDNLSKVLMIYHKMKYNLPTILCGDSGVGKSELTKYLCSVLGIKLKRFAVNEGHNSNDILNWLNPLIFEAKLNPKKEIIAFFDKVNTSNNLGLFKELICDNCVHNKVLPRNLKIVASCNPYRLRRYAGTDIESNGSSGQKSDILKDNIRALQRTTGLDIHVFSQCLIYKVYPMPVSILDHVFNFGSLNPTIEQLYIRAILLMEINVEDIGKSGLFFDCFTELIFTSQSFIRKVYMERSAVNLRDVKRCINLFKSFYQSLSKRNGIDPTFFLEESNFIIKNSIILSLGHCYYHRLSSKRDEFVKELEELFTSTRSKISSYFSYQKCDFINTLTEEQRYYTMHLNIPKGVALNHALRENIFMTLVCVLNRIPIFINGKSGSSKSLSLEILSTNLNGTASVNSFLRSLPSLEIFTYQCSQISTPESVKSCFESAKRYQKNSPNSIAIVLLNEVGLLEHSTSHPLKVVNKELEEDCSVSVIGLSNWTLDPNLINRAVYLTRPSPSTFELKTTLSGIVNSVHLDSTLYSLAKAYHDVYNGQQRKDFFGLRDFYHTVKFINRNFDGTLSPELLTDALARNFGGSNGEEFLRVLNIFFSCVGMNMISNRKSKLDYISENLNDTKARHLMLLTKNNAALSILFSEFKQLLAYDKAEVVFGPNFPNSTKELQVCMDIQRIKNAMSTGKTVVLVNCEQLYESLYDLFNLQYIEYDENRVVGISLGTYSRICSVHKNFRVIVIVDQDDAYSRLAKPLLNRFEKQTLHRDDLFDKSASVNIKNLCSRLQSWVKTTFGDDEKPFVNTHKSLLQSLVLSLDVKQIEDPSLHDYLLDICKNTLLWITTADAIVRMSSVTNSRTREYMKTYFEKQEHRDLPHLLHFLFSSLQEQFQNGLSNSLIYYGYFQMCLLTYSSVNINIDNLIQTSREYGTNIEYHSIISMAELKSEMELIEIVKQFFGKKIISTNGQHLLVLQCEMMNLDLLNQTKFIIQKHRKCISPNDGIGKNILLLINVVPGKSTSAQHLIEFDTPWKYAFVDEIRTTETTIFEIVNRPFAEQIQTTNVRQVIKNNFRTSLAMLRKFNTKINDITLLISRTNDLIDSDECWRVINKKVLEICHDYFSQNQINFYSTYVANHINEYFLVVNTYYSAIQYCVERILIKSFTFLLAEIDRNDNLRLFFEYKSTNRTEGTSLWIKLLDDLKRPSVNHMLTRNEQTISSMAELLRWKPIEVKSDGNNNRIFQARFPFSYEVCRNLHSWRSVCESSRLGVYESLQKHIDMIYPFMNNLSREYSEFFLYDYMCICGVQCTVLTNEVQYEIIKKMLDADSSEGSNIAKILAFYWRQERRLQSYYVLFETFPKSVLQRKFLQKLLVPSLRISSIEEIDMLLFSVIYHNLDPRNIETSHDITVANQRRNIWVKTLTDIKSPVEVLITLIHSTSINLTGGPRTSMLKNIGYIHEKWQKLQFYKEYLQEIAIPLGIVREISMILWQNMKTKSLSSQSSLDLILYFLDLVNKIGDNIQNDKSNNQSDESRKKTNITRFFEMFTAKFLVRRISKEDDIEKPLVGALMGIIKGENEKFNQLMKQATQNLKISILKKLLLNKNTKPLVNEELKDIFKEELIIEEKASSLDQSTLISYLTIYESVLQNIPEEQLSKLLDSISDNFVEVTSWKDIIKEVHLLAAIRCGMSIFSKRLISVVERGDSIRDLISSSPIARQLLLLLERPNFSFLKMVLLRLVVERKGRVFLLKTFRARVSPQLPWISTLLQGFKYTDNIPQNVLMHVLNGLEELASCVDMIMSLRHHQGDYNSKTESIIKLKASLEAIINTGQQIDIHSLKKLCYLAVIDKCYFSYCSENSNKDKFTKILTSEDEVNTQSCPIDITKLKNFLLKHVLRDDKEIHMTIKFASNAFNEDSFFFLNDNTTLENLTLIHIIHHICSVALSNYTTDQFWWLLLFDPTSLKDKYLPSVTDDARAQVINTIDNGTVSWYKCANNHVYVVDSCGYPTEFSMCPECGLPIGGFDHIPHFSNDKIRQDEDIAPTGYAVYEHFKERDLGASVRELGPISFRIIRVIIHSLLLAGNSIFPEREEEYRGVFHKTMSNVDNLNEFLLGHIKNDWSILCELLGGQNEEKASVLLFNILEFFSYSSKQLETKKRANPKLPYTSRDISTKTGRIGWETHFNGCVTMITENATKKYQLYYKQLDSIQKKGSNDVITNILLFSSAGAPQELKQPILPLSDPISQIWNIKPPITYEQFKSYFIADKAEKKYPVLSLFIRNEHLLYPTRYIPHVVKWQKLVNNTFSRRIDRHYARTRTVRDVFSEFISSLSLSPIYFQLGAEKASIEKIFDGWAKSFNHSWKFIERYQCLPLPAWCKNVSMSKDTPLSFSIPDEQDEGICALALIQFLVDKHNDIIDRAGKILNKTIENSPIEISSRFISKHHLVSFNVEEELMPVITDSELYKDTNKQQQNSFKFDYQRVEQFIINKYLSGKPKIKLELENFTFLNETRYSSGFGQVGGPVSELKSKIKQVELPTDMKQAIVSELRGSETSLDLFQSCIRQIEECISFLQAISGSSNNLEEVEKMSLIDYLQNILLINSNVTKQTLAKSYTIIVHVKLCHLVSLWSLLENELSPGASIESSAIANKYKKVLPVELIQKLDEFKNILSPDDCSMLISSMKELLLSYFTSETLDSEIPLKQMLEITPAIGSKSQEGNKLGDYEWLLQLSDEFKTCHLFEVYRHLSMQIAGNK